MPKFSIIIPVYNVAPYLRECLDSVLAQTFTDWEAICVDDGSTDGSGAILDEYAALYGEGRQKIVDCTGKGSDPLPVTRCFRVIPQENAGEGGARNSGLAAATGEWIFFLDGDDIMARGTLGVLDKLIAAHPDERLFRFAYANFNDGDAFPDVTESSETYSKRFEDEMAMDDFCTYVWQHLYHRTIVDGIRFKHYKRGCDRVYVDEVLLDRVNSLVQTDRICYLYRKRSGSAMNSVPSAQVLIDELDHRRDLVLMIEQSEKKVEYAGSWWLERYFTDQFGELVEQKPASDRGRLWGEWLKCVSEMKNAKGLSPHARRIYRMASRFPSHLSAWLLARAYPWYMTHGILPRGLRRIKRLSVRVFG